MPSIITFVPQCWCTECHLEEIKICPSWAPHWIHSTSHRGWGGGVGSERLDFTKWQSVWLALYRGGYSWLVTIEMQGSAQSGVVYHGFTQAINGRLVQGRQLVSNLWGCKGREGKCRTLHRLVLNNLYYNQLVNQIIASRRWTNQIRTHPK